jgi:hypothetical protein
MQQPTKRRINVYWMGAVPPVCELSGRPILDAFVDGAHPRHGWWANWHPDAFAEIGGVLGTGRGQRYEKQPDGRWLKTEG